MDKSCSCFVSEVSPGKGKRLLPGDKGGFAVSGLGREGLGREGLGNELVGEDITDCVTVVEIEIFCEIVGTSGSKGIGGPKA